MEAPAMDWIGGLSMHHAMPRRHCVCETRHQAGTVGRQFGDMIEQVVQ